MPWPLQVWSQELSGNDKSLRYKNSISLLHTRAGSLLIHNILPLQLAIGARFITILMQTWPREVRIGLSDVALVESEAPGGMGHWLGKLLLKGHPRGSEPLKLGVLRKN